jgi:hypothetical protein
MLGPSPEPEPSAAGDFSENDNVMVKPDVIDRSHQMGSCLKQILLEIFRYVEV